MKIQILDTRACGAMRAQLVDLLLDAVAHGGWLGMPTPVDSGAARRYWDGVDARVADGSCLLLAAVHEGTLVGAVQLDLCRQPHGEKQAEVQKMMVHSRARRRGIGSVLLRAVEAEAKALGRDLLFLDTEAGSGAEQLYHGLGYTCVAEMPEAACIPHGDARPTAIYYKTLLTPAHA
jgi:acetyltransferase